MNRKPLFDHLILDVRSLPDGTSELAASLSVTAIGKTKSTDPAERQELEQKIKIGVIRFAMADVIDAFAELKVALLKVGNGLLDDTVIKDIMVKIDHTLEGKR